MKRTKRTVLPFTLAGFLAVNGIVLPASITQAIPVSTNTKQFSDVASNHWANQHVIKMGLRNVVAGYEDGTFRPDESVTKLQALAMAVRNMGLAAETEKYKNANVLYDVPTWAVVLPGRMNVAIPVACMWKAE
jgi:hypothetical protein